jgi:sphingomyelin phosphodiesterase acid-like 3
MKGMMNRGLAFLCGLLALSCMGSYVVAQSGSTKTGQKTVSALLLSDIHFDPFHDPSKAARLVAAPASAWEGILAEPDSADQAAAFAALQHRCNARGVDTPYALFRSSLLTERTKAPDASFVTVSGDLIAHNFGCRYAAMVPGKTAADYSAFVAKTVDYVMERLRDTFPGVPIYAALGNNDSGCGDYRLDGGSDFLAATGSSVVAGLPKSANRAKALADFRAGGYYSVMMAAPMRNTRLIVLNDIFMSQKYATCGGHQDTAPAAAQLAWLQSELAAARQHNQRVWVMGHIPPGVDIYSTFRKMRNVCANEEPVMFLSSDQLGNVLVENADVVRLGIFAHTHMDELRLLEPKSGVKGAEVAIKMVPSISPVDGNNPSFTVARIDTVLAELADYKVIAASNQTGVDTSWSEEYDYARTYHQAVFSPAALDRLIEEFQADPNAKTEESRAYIRDFLVGDNSSLIKPLWPQYVCALSHYTAKGFAGCVCPAP